MKDILHEMNNLDDSLIIPSMLKESKQLRLFLQDYNKPLLIEVCGNIGFGKTTVAEINCKSDWH